MNKPAITSREIEDETRTDDPGEKDKGRYGRVLSSLALHYIRHNNPSRAAVLALAAMSMGDIRPATLLTVAEAMYRVNNLTHALTVLTRFERAGVGAVFPSPSRIEEAARYYITAKIYHKKGDIVASRETLMRARDLWVSVDSLKKNANV